MSARNLIRWSGLASVLFGVLLAASGIVRISKGPPILAVELAFAGVTVGLFALVGMYVRQLERSGIPGLVGFVVAMIGLALSLGQLYALTFSPVGTGPLGRFFPLGYGPFLYGFIVFSLVTIWAGVLPRWAAVLLIVGAVMNVAGIGIVLIRLIGVVIFGLGAIWLGYALWSSRTA